MVILGTLVFAGLGLGMLSPLAGFVAAMAIVATTSSLSWQLGFANLVTVQAYTVGFLVGAALRLVRFPAERKLPPSRRCAEVPSVLLVVFVSVATIIAWLPYATLPTEALRATAAELIGSVGDFNPRGAAGSAHAYVTAIIGVLLFQLGLRVLRSSRGRRALARSLMAGLVVSLTAVALQATFADPFIRPDRRRLQGTGITALFQDPNSFAAFLIIGLGLLLGQGIGLMRARRKRGAAAFFAAAAVCAVALLFCNSRAGALSGLLAAGIVGASASGALSRSARSRSVRPRSRPTRRRSVVALVLSALVIAATLTAWQATLPTGSRVSLYRLVEPLTSPDAREQIVSARLSRWAVAARSIRAEPMWGVGPAGLAGTMPEPPLPPGVAVTPRGRPDPDNVHNYFLQIAAEYGLPAAMALCWTLAVVLATLGAGIRVSEEPVRQGRIGGVAGGLSGVIAFSVVSHPMLLSELQAVFWTVAALGVAEARAAEGGGQAPGESFPEPDESVSG